MNLETIYLKIYILLKFNIYTFICDSVYELQGIQKVYRLPLLFNIFMSQPDATVDSTFSTLLWLIVTEF